MSGYASLTLRASVREMAVVAISIVWDVRGSLLPWIST
jgi:hypothetical protein